MKSVTPFLYTANELFDWLSGMMKSFFLKIHYILSRIARTEKSYVKENEN